MKTKLSKHCTRPHSSPLTLLLRTALCHLCSGSPECPRLCPACKPLHLLFPPPGTLSPCWGVGRMQKRRTQKRRKCRTSQLRKPRIPHRTCATVPILQGTQLSPERLRNALEVTQPGDGGARFSVLIPRHPKPLEKGLRTRPPHSWLVTGQVPAALRTAVGVEVLSLLCTPGAQVCLRIVGTLSRAPRLEPGVRGAVCGHGPVWGRAGAAARPSSQLAAAAPISRERSMAY